MDSLKRSKANVDWLLLYNACLIDMVMRTLVRIAKLVLPTGFTKLVPPIGYAISSYEPTSSWQQPLENKTSLRFGRYTKFEAISAVDLLKHFFDFVSYNKLDVEIP
ncbi:hypothetical protein Tco_0966318 [Tanacetum coccineum]